MTTACCTPHALSNLSGLTRSSRRRPSKNTIPRNYVFGIRRTRWVRSELRFLQCSASADDEKARLRQDTSGTSSRSQPEDDSGSGNDPQQLQPDPGRVAAKVAEEANIAKGQRTAVITGAVSIVFGVLYLILVQLLDSRGGEMLPPPPEAFGL